MKILMVLTSHDQLGSTGDKTGFWLEELASPYYVFKDSGAEITLASPKGGQPPLDPKSDDPTLQTAQTERFKKDAAAQKALANTLVLGDLSADDFDCVFYPGGHGPLWDLAEDLNSIALVEQFHRANKRIGAVCHAPAIFKNTKAADGTSLIAGKTVTGFSNSEEAAAQLTDIVPFLVEDMIKENGGIYTKGGDWESYTVQDGLLYTGQNPASSEAVAKLMLENA